MSWRAPLLIQYWHRETPPEEIADLHASFADHNPDLRRILFNRSTAERFVAEHCPHSLDAFRSCTLPASEADLLRYCAGYVLGGLCTDADIRCRGDLGALTEGVAEDGVLFGRQERLPEKIERLFGWPRRVGSYWAVANGLFAFAAPGHPLLELAIEISTANVEADFGEREGGISVWQATGPGVLTSLYLLHRLGSMDRFLTYTSGTALELTAERTCATVGSHARVERAFERVEIRPLEGVGSVLEHVKMPRRVSGAHWSETVRPGLP